MQERGERAYDIALFGATGFTGGLTAEYLAAHLPEGARWAIAGRSDAKLAQVRDRLATINPAAKDIGLLHADVNDPALLRAVAESARVVASTVGPFLEHGEPLVAACAAAGTDYLDITGEPEFIDRMYLAHHDTAVRSGARLVHACGFDSVPHDLGVLFTVKQLPPDVPLSIEGIVRSNAAFSSGTYTSAIDQVARYRQMQQTAKARKQREPRPEGRRARARGGSLHYGKDIDLWLVPLPTVDPVIVKHSAAARADYGPDFAYAHYAGVKKTWTIAKAATALSGVVIAAQIPPLRERIKARIPQGEGPSESRRARSWFTVDFIGSGGGKRVHTQVRGGDPGYTETAKMLSEAAMSLAFDDNPPTSGQVTTATAMGEHLMQRLQDAGMTFEVLRIAG